jgi:hypothetical protein
VIVLVARVTAKLEPVGAQLSMLRVMRELREHGIASALYCGWATAAGIELAQSHGPEPEVCGEGGNPQWIPEPRFAAWLGPRLVAADVVHAHMFGAWWRPRAALPRARRCSPASTTGTVAGPAADRRAAPGRCAASTCSSPTGRAPAPPCSRTAFRSSACARASPVVGTDARPAPGLPSPRIVFAGRLDLDKRPTCSSRRSGCCAIRQRR